MFGSSKSWGLNSTHLHGTHVPVEEPSTASIADMCGATCDVRYRPIADMPLTQSPRRIYSATVAGQKLPASQQSAMTLASDQDRDTSGKSRTQARSFTHLDRRILPGCSQQQGDIDHVRL